ncbi:Site-specific recombinase XerD [Ekhidna lutea]|uniref:Site-specific recombinase XerD n=1 Tax=Ekhidna lutea TaxID=447679 RepID=A0A239KG23_EKHLU|nr:site-specific integrase [Ekhidna lutea]SNT17277.1 Site-specific recombinase XerD [Ekhidna lutea]
MNNTFSILFWLLNSRISKKTGEAPIMARITVNGKRAELATGKKVMPEKWNVNAGKVRGNSEEARVINYHLSKMEVKLQKIYDKLVEDDQYISSSTLKNLFLGKTNKQHSLLKLFRYHNDSIEKQVGKEYSSGTLERYKTAYRHVESFVKDHYGREDFALKDLNYTFVNDYELYLKSTKGIGHNTTMKYIRQMKKIIILAIKNEWLDRDPFARFEITTKEVKKGYLNKEELSELYSKEFGAERLEHVRDAFLFCCYTGLSYSDVKKLTPDNISKGMDGECWIFVDRTKTGSSSNVPLLPIPAEIIKKYETHPIVLNTGCLLPIISNQRVNAYLKEIATICGIKKNVTFHMARHTFATTVTLSNGVAIESVGSMLGHKNLKTTQIYAKVVQEKVSEDMKALKNKLGASGFGKAVNQ